MTRPRCDHQPEVETCRTDLGRWADVRNSRDYPVTAICLGCGVTIRSEQYLVDGGQRPWKIVTFSR